LEVLQKGARAKIELNPMPQWYGQFNPIFKEPCGCWETDNCNGKRITSNQCCNRAARKIMENAKAIPGDRIIVAQTNRPCADSKNVTISYSSNGISVNATAFEEAVKVIDISLTEHKLPIMVGVQHPYKNQYGSWYYKCGSTANNPRATNHFVVITGKNYDETKKMWFYSFYEVAVDNAAKGTSEDNKLWINAERHLIMGNTSISDKENYYTVTDVIKNQGKTYNLNK
jgi:hypothetical protein